MNYSKSKLQWDIIVKKIREHISNFLKKVILQYYTKPKTKRTTIKTITLITALSISLLASVDVNHANAKELTSLKGAGAKKAQAIVDYRIENGCFESTSSLTKVKGIGKKFVEKNKKDIEIKPCKI